jgi:hypothetical protein
MKTYCQKCGAAPGTPCLGPKGRVLKASHEIRRAANAGHVVRLSRYTRGHDPVSNAKLYGYTVECSCGAMERTRWNGPKHEAIGVWKDHAREGLGVQAS